jgi:hypothetical protein
VQINLTETEVRTFRDLLHDYLPALKLEVARTESHEFRHLLVARQELCERLLRELQRADASGAQFSSTSRLPDKDVL